MTWFAKYWILKHKYDELFEKYMELVDSIDSEFWKEYLDE